MQVVKCNKICVAANTDNFALAHLVCRPNGKILGLTPENLSGLYIVEARRHGQTKIISVYEVITDDGWKLEVEEKFSGEHLPIIFQKPAERALQEMQQSLSAILFVTSYGDTKSLR